MASLSRLLVCLVSLVATVHAVPPSERSLPGGWSLHRRADPTALLPLKFMLAQSNLNNIDAYLLDVADPRSPNYGKHWTPAKVADTFRPSEETVEVVHSWLVGAGVEADKIKLNRNKDTIHLNLTIAEAERLLGAEYYVYHLEGDDNEHIGCHQGYTLPEHVSKHVDLVSPTTYVGGNALTRRDASTGSFFGRDSGVPKMAITTSQLAAADCDTAVTLDCLRELYKFDYTPISGDRNTVAVVEFAGQIYKASDLDLFFDKYAPDLVGHIPTLISVAGGVVNVSGSSGESDLDIELIMGLLGPQQNLSLYQVSPALTITGNDLTDEFLAALDGTYCDVDGVSQQNLTDCGNKPKSNVVSISYHFNPDLIDDATSPILKRQCTEFAKLSLTGMTFVASSGDGGVAYSGNGFCQTEGGLRPGNPSGNFVTQFPASCPYVTAVGATSVAANNTVDDPEVATTWFASGGGFSNNFARPSWQDAVVTDYIEKFAPDYAESVYNRSGRAYPDVAANGWPIIIATGGKLTRSGGTSASAPIFAALVAAVNDARLAQGKSPVGFINPALYSDAFAGAYNDVTNGTNPGCQTDGFVAAPGWDPVTGWGTPNFPKLLDAFLALP